LGTIFTITIILFVQKKWIKNYKTNYIFGLLIFSNLFLFGSTYTAVKDYRLKNNYQKHIQKDSLIKGEVTELLVEKKNSYEALIAIKTIVNNKKQITTHGKVKCYFPKEEIDLLPSIGDIILFKCQLNEIEPPNYPHQFDYKSYLASKEILHSTFIPINKFIIVDRKLSIYGFAQSVRNNIISQFKTSGLKENELNILSALFLGHKQSLSKETKNNYTNAGAMHVLAVSGLHVGIVLYLFTYLFDFLFGKTKKKKLKIILILLAIWGFALLTGLSISVIRSAVMFSFLAVGSLLSNKINIYNSIAASAFIILLINPNSLFDVGFQLSYVAVIGIVYFYPKIYNLFYINNRLINYVWSITAVSISAQIVTTPLSIYYFHQIPTYAILSNLFVIYFAITIISLSIIALLTLVYSPLFNLISSLLNYVIKILNQLIESIANLPVATIDNLFISGIQLILIFISLIIVVLFLETKHKIYVNLALFSISMFCILEHIENYSFAKSQKLMVYNTPNDLSINIMSKNINQVYTSDTSELNKTQLSRDLSNNWGTHDLPNPEFNFIDQLTNQEIRVNNQTLLILNAKTIKPLNEIFDYIIINNNELDLGAISEKVKGKEYFIGSKIKTSKEKAIKVQNRFYNFKIQSLKKYHEIDL
jgi:competence protein ComEC